MLVGAKTEKIERWYHERLSTYGIGKDRDRRTWRHLADELLRLPDIDGGLIGGASLEPKDFASIVQTAARMVAAA